MKNLKFTIPLLFFCILSFTLLAKNKSHTKKQDVTIITDEEIKASADELPEKSFEDPQVLPPIEEQSLTAMAKHMYDFHEYKEENKESSGPSLEIKQLSKKLDQCQYPNENKKVVRKVRGIKSFITLFSYKKNI